MEPPTERMDAFWPSLAERMEESPAAEPVAGGGGPVGREEEIVFESSAAMQVLNIPEPPPEPVAVSPEAAESAGAVAPAPAASPWRWPVALIFSTAIVVVGILAYKKMNPPQQPTYMASAAGGQERGQPHPGDPGQPGQPGHPGQPGQPAAPAPGEPPVDEAKGDETATGAEPAAGDEAKAEPGDEAKTEPGAEPKAEPPKTADGKPKARAKTRSKRRPRKGGAAKEPARPVAKPAAKPARRPTRPKKKKPAGDELDSLIDGVIGKQAAAAKKKKPAKAAAPLMPGLPEQLSQVQIRNSMKKIMGRVQACYDKYQVEGNARVKLTITKAGAPSNVSIKGKFFGTDTGACVVKAVKKARFPKFSGKAMTIRYPFLLQ